ncbi:hypothetical protein D5086_019869 [Populus alba]|uniref:Uncharacterized protein n=1 Tax=Populus alba TaxID=43335 RepID=A0ACC4BJ23_POPAL
MTLFGKMEAEVEVKVSAETFHDIFSCRPHHISNMSPAKIQNVDLHEGEWGKPGSVICWSYVHGKAVSSKIIPGQKNTKDCTAHAP